MRFILVLSFVALTSASEKGAQNTNDPRADPEADPQADPQALFNALWDQFAPVIDTNGDSKVTLQEFRSMMTTLDIAEAPIIEACTCTIQGMFDEYDVDNDGKLDKSEIMSLAANNAYLGPMIVSGISMAPDSSSADDTMNMITATPPEATLSATYKVETSLSIQASQIYAGSRRALKEQLMLVFPNANPLIILYTPNARRARRTLVATPTWTVTATAFVADSSAAALAVSAVAASPLSDPAQASSLLGVTVSSGATAAPVAVTGMKEMPTSAFALAALIVGLPLVFSILACCVSSKSAKSAGATGGCTQAGCCSNYALRGAWSPALAISCILLLVASIMIYNNMSAFTASIIGIINTIMAAYGMGGPLGQIAQAVPAEQMVMLSGYLGLLDLMAMLPGVVSAIIFLIVFVFGMVKTKGGFCVAKFFIGLGYFFLFASTIVYFIYTVISLAMFVPQVQTQLRQFLVLCDTAVPTLTQTVNDGMRALEMAEQAGMSDAVAIASTQLYAGQAQLAIIQGLCAYANAFITAAEGLLVPAFLAFSMSLVTWYNAFGTCCAMGCCKSPHGNKVSPSA